MEDTKYGKNEVRFLSRLSFSNFTGPDCNYAILQAGRPDVMFCRIGLELSSPEKNVRLLIEADHRLFCRFLDVPAHTSATHGAGTSSIGRSARNRMDRAGATPPKTRRM